MVLMGVDGIDHTHAILAKVAVVHDGLNWFIRHFNNIYSNKINNFVNYVK